MQAEQRAEAILKTLGLSPATRGASGRYQRSLPIRPGVRYWSSSQPRSRRDLFGVQFYGEGLEEGQRYADALATRGFVRRRPQTGQLTFAKPIAFRIDDGLDAAALSQARREVETALAPAPEAAPRDRSGRAFREFMLRSPWADLDVEPPERKGGARDISPLFED